MFDKIYKIGDDKYHYTSGYYNQNKWMDNGDVILARSIDPQMRKENKIELIRYSLTEERVIEVLCDDMNSFSSYVVYKDVLYYGYEHGLKAINLSTGEKRVIYKLRGTRGCSMPHITNDGRFVSIFTLNEKKESEFVVINVETEESKVLCRKKFEEPFGTANHGMVCPTDPDIMFFAHEGTTFYISNRLWVYDANKNKMWNVAKQELDENGNLGDCFGHESWAPDGKGLYFVKYSVSPKPPYGICYVDIESGKIELLFSKYKYWHVGVSKDGRYLTADTDLTDDSAQVVIIDTIEKTETVIETTKVELHPAHPHPQLSPDNSKLMYTELDENDRVCTKIIEVNLLKR